MELKDVGQLLLPAILLIVACCCAFGVEPAAGKIDPLDLQVLKNISEKYSYNTWTFDTDPCSPNAPTSWTNNVKCDCSFDDNKTCHVVYLEIFGENLAGPFPIDIISLRHLTYLSLGNNFLYGPLPPELGTLTGLTNIGVGTNSLSGPIPHEFGDLINLSALYMDSNEFTGEIPFEIFKLSNLKTLWLFDNNLSGSIPDIFANMTSLVDLRIYGNNLHGQIPESVANLTGIGKLYIGDLSNGGLFPSGLENLQNLSELSLRNNGLIDSIPASFGSLTKLTFLDLSFNNLTGVIPQELWASKSLTTLYLGVNSLVGKLPDSQVQALTALDVSFNQLQGEVPSWLDKATDLQVNLIWNSFNTSSQNNTGLSALPLLNCGDQSGICDGAGQGNSHFAINVGGSAYNGSSIYYDADAETLGSASTFLNARKTWLVSNVGQTTNLVSDVSIQEGNDPILFMTARESASTLRYFGLGMDNGMYTIELMFAEISFGDGSLAERIFDVYIQGNRVLKEFNIQKAANGSYKPVTKKFEAEVLKNVLDIHFFWSGKGTCCIPDSNTHGPLVSSINVYSGTYLQNVNQNQTQHSKKSGSSAGKIVGIVLGIVIVIAVAIFIFVRRKWQKCGHVSLTTNVQDVINIQRAPNQFSYNDLKIATNNFHPNNKLGEGGFGAVYKGFLSNGAVVAIKVLSSESKQGKREFMNEVTLITEVKHRNLVRLNGCCLEGEQRLLVYEYLEKKSLDQILFDPKEALALDWPTRFNIIIGAARGLAYLHEESQPKIIHRDIKASNILLDNKLQPKIADFGLARLFVDDESHVTTGVAGTIGYVAPEYAMRGQLTEKADVYSFGVVILEIVSGRKNTDSKLPPEKEFLLDWAWNLYEKNRLVELIDQQIAGSHEDSGILRVIKIALLCAQATASMRPTMTRVVSMLLGDMDTAVMPLKPNFLSELNIPSSGHQNVSSTTSRSHVSSSLGASHSTSISSSSTSGNSMPLHSLHPK